MYHASTKLSVVPDFPAVSHLIPRCQYREYPRRMLVTVHASDCVITCSWPGGCLLSASTLPLSSTTLRMLYAVTFCPPFAKAAYAEAWSIIFTADDPMPVLAFSASREVIPS